MARQHDAVQSVMLLLTFVLPMQIADSASGLFAGVAFDGLDFSVQGFSVVMTGLAAAVTVRPLSSHAAVDLLSFLTGQCTGPGSMVAHLEQGCMFALLLCSQEPP